jgi:hypothetical protein
MMKRAQRGKVKSGALFDIRAILAEAKAAPHIYTSSPAA